MCPMLGSDRDFVCLADGLCVGVSPARTWRWFGNEVLASALRFAVRGRLVERVAGVARRTVVSRRQRLVQSRVRQLFGASALWGEMTGPNPTDRGKNRSKRHVVCDGHRTPLAIVQTGENVHDSEQKSPTSATARHQMVDRQTKYGSTGTLIRILNACVEDADERLGQRVLNHVEFTEC